MYDEVRLVGGGNKSINDSQNKLDQTAALQAQTSSQLANEGQQLIDSGQAAISPLNNFLRSIIGGNSTTTNQTIAPAIGNITNQANATREQIRDTTPAGAGRDVLLGQVTQGQGAQVASLENNAFLSAFPELASLGSGQTSAGLGLTGAGITSLSNSATTTSTVLNSKEQQKAATLNAFGSLAGAAGTAFGGTDLSKL